MRNTLVFGLAVSMIATSMALAAPKKVAGQSASSKKAAVSKKVAAKKAAVKKAVAKAQATTPAPVVAAPVVVPEAQLAEVPASSSSGQSTSTVAEATQEVKKSKFGFLLVDRAGFGVATANRGETSQADAVMTARPSYKLTDTVSVAVGIDIGHSFGANEVDGEPSVSKAVWTPYDTYLMVAKSNLATLPGDIKTRGYIRYYLPTSEASQDAGQIGVTRGDLTFSRGFGPFTAKYIFEPRYYFQQYKTYQKPGATAQTANMDYRLQHYAELDFQAAEKLTLYTLVGVDHKWTHGDDNFGVKVAQKDMLFAETGIGYDITSNFSLIIGMEQSGPDLRSPKDNSESNALYREDRSSYFVEADIIL